MEENQTVERIEAPTRERFFEEYVARNRPVILTGVATDWPAMKRWSPEYFKRVAGDSKIVVHYNDGGNFHEWYVNKQRREDRHIPFGELVDLLGTPEGVRYYMTEHEIDKISEELALDVDFREYIIPNDVFHPMLFLGRDTCMPLHYHGTTEALLCQLHGSKRVRLYEPGQFELLYPGTWFGDAPLFSRVNGMDPDLERYSRFAEAKPLDFRLEPGEILFIPVHWWHLTNVEGYQVSVTQIWRASVRQWTFPRPGLQMAAREVVYKSKKGLRGVKRRLRRVLGRRAS